MEDRYKKKILEGKQSQEENKLGYPWYFYFEEQRLICSTCTLKNKVPHILKIIFSAIQNSQWIYLYLFVWKRNYASLSEVLSFIRNFVIKIICFKIFKNEIYWILSVTWISYLPFFKLL